jgi:hypothetical protein
MCRRERACKLLEIVMPLIRFILCSLTTLLPLAAYAGGIGIDLTLSGEVSPGVYGQVNLGNRPPPPVVYAQPMIIVPQRPGYVAQPLYLHVPPGHARNWKKHCREYDACGHAVYFVKSAEYEPGYRPERRGDGYRRDGGERRDDDHGHGHGHDHRD